jgi:hypothetical protein
MYSLAGATGALIARAVPAHYELFLWLDRFWFLVWGVLAGALLMRFLTWRLRWLSMLALPVCVMLILPTLATWKARSFIQGYVSYFDLWLYYVYLGIPVLGMTVGGLLAARLQSRGAVKLTSPESADTP